MRIRIGLPVTVTILLCIFGGCNSTNPNKPRALNLLSEVNEISRESSVRLKSGNIQAAIARLDEHKKTFPDNLVQIRSDAQMVKDFFEKEIVVDQETEDKLGEVLTLGPSKEDADCVESRIKFQQLLTQRIESYIGELNLLLDKSIVDQKTLQIKIATFQEKGAELNLRANELQTEIANVCSKSSFKVK